MGSSHAPTSGGGRRRPDRARRGALHQQRLEAVGGQPASGRRFRSAKLINDFTAQALAAPRLTPRTCARSVRIRPRARATWRSSARAPASARRAWSAGTASETPLTTEGGHIAFAPFDDVEIEILRVLAKEHGRCSIERILSGPGIEDLHVILAKVEGREGAGPDRQADHRARRGRRRLLQVTIDRFCAILGSAAGDLALALARGAGCSSPAASRRASSTFWKRASSAPIRVEGPAQRPHQDIPTHVVMNPHTALIGAAVAMTPDGKAAIS